MEPTHLCRHDRCKRWIETTGCCTINEKSNELIRALLALILLKQTSPTIRPFRNVGIALTRDWVTTSDGDNSKSSNSATDPYYARIIGINIVSLLVVPNRYK